MIKPDNLILLGKLIRDNDQIFLRSNFDTVYKVSEEDYVILNQMNGFVETCQIAEKSGKSVENVWDVLERYGETKTVTTLENWNKIGWCENCQTYVSGNICGICKNEIKKLVFGPPCDPTMCFEQEGKLIKKKFEELGIKMPDDAFYLINCGVENGKFYWEVAYNGEIICKIQFNGNDYESWEIRLLESKEKIEMLKSKCNAFTTRQRLIKANENRQMMLVENANARIDYAYGIYETKPLLYYSAGKESSVIYSLLKSRNKLANVLTVSTGIDFPEDLEFMKDMVKCIEKEENFNCYYFEGDGNDAINYLNSVGKLSITDPWCRLLIKKKQKNIGTEYIYGDNNFVAFEGTRWYETNYRRSNTTINILKAYPKQIWVCPIIDWTAFDVWIYLFSNDEPINPIYKMGFQRSTCWLCPAINPFSIYLSKKYYPYLWEKISGCEMEAFTEDNDKEVIY